MNFDISFWDLIVPLTTFLLGCAFTCLYDSYKVKQSRKEYFYKQLYEPAALLYWRYGILGQHEASFWDLTEEDQQKFIEIVSKAKLYSDNNKELDKILEDCLYAYNRYNKSSKMIREACEEAYGKSPFWDLEYYIDNKLKEESKKYK